MARVTFTKDDILKVKIVTPNWYPVLVKSFSQEQASTDGSDLYVFQLVIEGDSPFKGVPVRLQGSEKFYSSEFIEFVEIANGGLTPGVPVEFEKLVGKHLNGFVQRGEYKGKPQNQFAGFKKLEEAK